MDTTVNFRGTDSGVTSMFDKFRAAQKEQARDMMRDALTQSQTAKEAEKNLEKQIETQRKLLTIKQQAAQLEALRSRKATEEEYKHYNSDEWLREKEKASPADKSWMREQEINARSRYEKRGKEYSKEISQAREEYLSGVTQINVLKEILEAIKSTGREEIKNDRKNVEATIAKGEKPKDAAEEAKQAYQAKVVADSKERESEETKKPRTALEVMKGILGASFIQRGLGKVEHAFSGILGAESGEQAIPAIWGILPGGDVLAAAAQKHVQEAEQVAKATNIFRARLGKGAGFSAGFGFDISETMPIAEEFVTARGGEGRGGYAANTTNLIALMKNYGIDKGTLLQNVGYGRFDKSGNEVMGNIVAMVQTMVNSGVLNGADNTRVLELLKTQNALTEEQTATLETVNQSANSNIVAAFDKLGGSFTGVRGGARLSAINQALMTPNNEYQQAMSYAVLSQLNPGMGLFGLMEEQEKGVASPMYMSATMKQLNKRWGSGDKFLLALKNRMGLTANQARTLGEGYLMDNTIFDKMTEEQLVNLKAGAAGVIAGAGGKTTLLEAQQAELANRYSEGMWKGLATNITQAGQSFEKAVGMFGPVVTFLVNKINQLAGIETPAEPKK